MYRVTVLSALVLGFALANACEGWDECEVRARTTAGCVCGSRRLDARGGYYASFRGVPYAKQPLGELRFKELEPPEPWTGFLNATTEGPVCPQTDILYGDLMQPQGMSEACIHANIHVPLEALPTSGCSYRAARHLKSPAVEAQEDDTNATSGLPILVYIHGGGFAFGSGDADVYGPEYLVANGVIVITFNYRLNVFGFLSLNSAEVPGNNGLRDMITLLRWVRANARAIGGDPDDVTLGGQSAGAAAAHLLTLAPKARGLFNKAIIMSGTALPSFYTTSPAYAQYLATSFLSALGINSTDPAEQHAALVAMPLEALMQVNTVLQDVSGLGAFYPVVDGAIPGAKPIILDDPEALQAKGYGDDIPLLIGYTNAECESLRNRLEEINIVGRLYNNKLTALSPEVLFNFLPEVALAKAMEVQNMYTNDSKDKPGAWTVSRYIEVCSDQFFKFPAYKVAEHRMSSGGAPAYLYQFSYESDDSPVKLGLNLDYRGAGHVEDMAYVFHINSVPVPENSADDNMRKIMTDYITGFMRTGCPHCGLHGMCSWHPLNGDIQYQEIHRPICSRNQIPLTDDQIAIKDFFTDIFTKS